jgi:CheY-like chemotaxis protein
MAGRESRGVVLVVEDTDTVRWMLELILEHAGYESRTVANGAEALAYLDGAPLPNVIILDLSMPVMTGWEFLERRKLDERLSMIPVVLYSGEVSVPQSCSRADWLMA